jgi:hypothetical protein
MMDHSDIKWSSLPAQFISTNSEIPPDILFLFKGVSSDDAGVAAHKMILAMVSQVFRNMFYVHDTTDRVANKILIEDTTKPAFQIMIDAVYNAKPMKDSLKGLSLHEIFAVLYLVTKYEIHNLVLKVKEFLSSFPITEDIVLAVATDAMEYLDTFGAVAQNVLLSCAKFLRPKFPNVNSLLRFVAENGDRITTVHKLVVLMDQMTPPICSNCDSETCLNGKEVQVSQFKVGLK